MGRAMEEMVEKERAEAKLEERTEIIVKMRKNGLSMEQIAEIVGIPENEIEQLLNE